MKEKRDIIRSYNELLSNAKRCALATVVHVEGSSYRRPGARMLISEDGTLTGAISGGCLEGDVMRKALQVINQQVPALVTYDTMDDDDALIGIGLGCNGIIKILIEPVDLDGKFNPIKILNAINEHRQKLVIATFFSFTQTRQAHAGTRLFLDQQGELHGDTFFLDHNTLLIKKASEVLESGKSEWLDFTSEGEEITVFLEFVAPAISLVIAGAGNDVKPLVEMADVLGWDTKIIDGRPNYARRERFPKACDVILSKPMQVFEKISIDDYTCFILMTHNYNYDKMLLYELCKKNVRYVAMLGPKKKLERMVLEFEEEGRPLTPDEITMIYSPAGLDIGAETSEEIALSILAEIKAIMGSKKSNHLRQKLHTIHA